MLLICVGFMIRFEPAFVNTSGDAANAKANETFHIHQWARNLDLFSSLLTSVEIIVRLSVQ